MACGLLLAVLFACTAAERASGARTYQNEVEGGGYARLRVNTVDKVKVEAISREEAIRMRQSGYRFHEVEHHHFSDRSSKNGKLWQELKEAAKEKVAREFPWEQKPQNQSTRTAAAGGRSLKRQEAFKKDNTSSKITKDLEKVLFPQEQIRPQRVGGFLCAQFDLDLFALSGGVFPGLLGIGLLGDIHYQPATKCFGWTAELYLMLSIGFGLFGMDFRVALVVIATLVVTERPLAAGAKDLVWELPPGFDTSRCHNKNPFSLISSTSREGFGFIYTHILTNKYLKHAEVEVQNYLEKNRDDIANFKKYLDLIEPPRALPAKLVSASQSQGLAKEGIVGNVEVRGEWLNDTIELTVVLPKNLQVKGANAYMMRRVARVGATIWQDLGDALLSYKSDGCYHPAQRDYTCSFVLPVRPETRAFVQLTLSLPLMEYAVPLQLDPVEKTFSFPASFRASLSPQDGTLSCQRLTAEFIGSTDCKKKEITEVQLEVQVSRVRATASWTPAEFGEVAPWGITVPQSHYEKNHEEIHKALADSSANNAMVRVYQLKNDQILSLLSKAPISLVTQQSQIFLQDLWAKVQRPSPAAASILTLKGLQPLMRKFLRELQYGVLALLRNASQEVLMSSGLVQSVEVSEDVRQIMDSVVHRLHFGERACPEIALRAAFNKPENPAALLRGLEACMTQSKRFYYGQAIAAARNKRLVSIGWRDIDAENITKKLTELFPDSKLQGERARWVSYGHRTVNSQSCVSTGFLGAGSPEECQAGCDRAEDDNECNTVVFEEDDGWCSLWRCSPWDAFPHQPAKTLSVKTDTSPELNVSNANLVIFAGLPDWALEAVVDGWSQKTKYLEEILEKLSKVPDHEASWARILTEEVWHSPASWPRAEMVAEGAYRRLLVDILLEDAIWMKDKAAQDILYGQLGFGKNGVMIGLIAEKTPVRNFFPLQTDFSGHAGHRWQQIFELKTQGGCRAHVKTSWVWQVPSAAAYYVRPSMVPVAQSLFAAYDQFVSKLPSYGAQVLQRLQPKQDSMWKVSVLPYDSTDGRHLHRHLKKGEQDRVKVYKGEVATDDAVYNFPKAIKESKYRDSQNFHYNVGLSAANLFLRVVSDVQALFHLYFADHPDWDGVCQSLPAQFNLLYEWETARVPSNWAHRLQGPRKDINTKLTHRAGETVSEQGAEITSDGEAMIKNWHWVSKPRWFNKEDSRAAFFTQTAPAHGKDGWATPDASQLSAVVWPHVWCELIQQEWSTAAAAKEAESPRGGRDSASAVEGLRSLERAIPLEAARIIEKAEMGEDSDILARMFTTLKLTGAEGVGCPVRMMARENQAVDLITQPIIIGWGRLLKISEHILDFYKGILAGLADQQEALDVDAGKQGDASDEEAEGGPAANETPQDANAIATSRSAQLDTLTDTLSVSSERWRTEGVSERGMRTALVTLWTALFKNMTEADTHAAVEARRNFQELRDKLNSLVIAQQERIEQIGEHLDRLLPEPAPAGNASATAEGNATADTNSPNRSVQDVEGLKFAVKFATLLTAAVAERQKEVVMMLNKVFNCIDVVARPEELPDAAFDQWTQDETSSYRVEDVRKRLSYNGIYSVAHEGAELFFEEACSLPVNTNFNTPEHERFERLREPRPECERVVLGNAIMSIFPNFASRVMAVYGELQNTLESMAKQPSKALMLFMLSTVQSFVARLSQGGKLMGMDNDFYKAFSYRKDGSLVGRLWSNLPSALAEIAATLQMRQEGRKTWITEGIAYRSRLKTARRGRVRELEKNKVQIPTKEEGCVCHDEWHGYEWINVLPRSVVYEGCVKVQQENRWLRWKANASWEGVCKTKEESQGLVKCHHKYANCDPAATPVKPQFQIWRAADVLHADPVKLPLLQLDLYLHVDIRNRRADFCTPNFAPIMLDTNWHWSSSSWLPYDLRRSVCFGARIHPPGVSLAVTRCSHRGIGNKRLSKSTEWSLTGVAYLVSHYNVWGTGDGDMTHSWFGGGDNWGSKAMSTGWPNFLMADPGTWASSSAGSGYLSTPNVMGSSSTFWFSLVAEVLSALSLTEAFTTNDNTTTTMAVVKGVMVSAATITWKLLQRYNVIPALWDLFVNSDVVLKTFGDLGLKNLLISPFRNEHDVVLSFKMATQWTRRELDLKKLIGDLSLDQMRIVFETADSAGLPVKAAWEKYQSTAAGSAQDVHNLNRETLIALTRVYLQTSAESMVSDLLTAEQFSQKLLQSLFGRCPGRPLWYKVNANARVPIYTFWRRDSSAWVSPPLPAGTEIMISQWDQDWLRVIAAVEEEDRFIPSRYVGTPALQLVSDVISTPLQTGSSRSIRALTADQVENILRKVSMEALQCWAIYIKSAKPDLMKAVIKEAWRTERERIYFVDASQRNNALGPEAVAGVADGVKVPLGFFSPRCIRNFFFEHYDGIVAGANTSVKDAFNLIFYRGKGSRMELDHEKSREIATAKTSYTDIGLSILTRLGFPFISLPGIFQLQPYLQLSVQYDVAEIIRILKARIRGNRATPSMTSYLRRKEACETCVTFGRAFCDRQEAADAMLLGGHDEAMDVCEPRTKASKARCREFFWSSPASGAIFDKAVCPCYKAVSGTQIQPRWITSLASCADISWPDSEIEELKRASKDRDWRSGFAVADTGDKRLQMGQVPHVAPPKLKDCFGGYRCCGWSSGGKPEDGQPWAKVRCVHMKSLYDQSSWFHRKSACKYYTPTDVKGEWHHALEACGEGMDEGHFTWSQREEKWIREESIEAQAATQDVDQGAVLDQNDNA